MDQFKITIAGEQWTVRWSRSVTDKGYDCWGLCEKEHRRIRLHRDLKKPRYAKLLRKVLAHEVLHGTAWPLGEECVEQSSSDIVEALDVLASIHPEARGQCDGQAKRRSRKAP